MHRLVLMVILLHAFPSLALTADRDDLIARMKFVRVPKGTFWMSKAGKNAQVQVTIPADFELAAYLLTQEQWEAVLGENPSAFSRQGAEKDRIKDVSNADLRHFPVENVAWVEVRFFLEHLNEREKGKGWLYRLPTDAEWEYACRNASTAKEECSFDFYFDKPTNDLTSRQANFNGDYPGGHAAKGPNLGRPTKVGSYAPNKLGLYDMHGNLLQWCADLYSEGGTHRAVRGSGWFDEGWFCKAAYRRWGGPTSRSRGLGVRLARVQADQDQTGAIDTHTHFYDPHRPQGVPWPGKADKLLYRTVLPAEFKELTKNHHVQGTIVVEASPWLEDNQWLLDLAGKEPFIVGVVGRLDPASDDFPKHLERFTRDPLFRGMRINHDELKRGLKQQKFMDHLRLLVKHDLTLDVNGGPDMPADVAKLAQQNPDLRIVINHAANLTIDGKAVPAAWLKGMQDAAAGKRVFCKVSALVEGTRKRNGDAPKAVDFYRPVLDALWTTFGADRLLYGSNWPVSNNAATYATLYEIARSYFAERGADASENFFRRNAIAAYKPVIRTKRP